MDPSARRDAVPYTAEDLGFVPEAIDGNGPKRWIKRVGAHSIRFRRLETVPELAPVEELQRAVFVGISDRDLLPAETLLTAIDTGGIVLGAFRIDANGSEEPVGFSIAWGGYVGGRPRLVSDFLGVREEVRGGGLGAELKRLQAALAVAAGFLEIVWTVDPLRAANARLNFERLGAYCDRYEVDRYGSGFAEGLYGGLPSDRLLMTWPVITTAVRDRLLGVSQPHGYDELADLPHFDTDSVDNPERALVSLPSDIDRLVHEDPEAARRWREQLRGSLLVAFGRGYAITGFASNREDPDSAVFLLEQASVRAPS